jgi:hypothetical protein
MGLHQRAEAVTSGDDLVGFVAALRLDLEAHPEQWENPTRDRFLEAMEGWIEDTQRNTEWDSQQHPSWRTFAEILCAARIYE